MATRLQKIEDLARKVVSSQQTLRVVQRGIPRYVDRNLRGVARFARKRGAVLPTWSNDSAVLLSEAVVRGARDAVVTRLLQPFSPGSLVRVGGRELLRLDDVILDEARLRFDSAVLDSYAVNTVVSAYAVPITSAAPFRIGASTVLVRSGFELHNGDALVLFGDPALLRSATEYRIQQARTYGVVNGEYTVEVDLESGIPANIDTDQALYCAVRPAYRSPRVRLPALDPAGLRRIGPFLLDYLSGRFRTRDRIDETLSVQLFDQRGQPLPDYEYPVTVAKNSPIVRLPIYTDSLLFWRRVSGRLDWNGRRTLLRHDADGHVRVTQPLTPSWPSGVEWAVRVRCSHPALIRVGFLPSSYREFSIGPNELTEVIVGSGAQDAETTQIDIISRSAPEAVLEWGDARPVGVRVESMEYRIVSGADNPDAWQACSAVAKPVFFTLDDVSTRYSIDAFNSGGLLFG